MSVTKDLIETIRARRALRDYVNATVGFETLTEDMNKDPKSLMRMLIAKGNSRADNLLA